VRVLWQSVCEKFGSKSLAATSRSVLAVCVCVCVCVYVCVCIYIYENFRSGMWL
jgi:hypothetical protein